MQYTLDTDLTNYQHEIHNGRRALVSRLRHLEHSFNDQPAVIYINNPKKIWLCNGMIHRDETLRPAVIEDQTQIYYSMGLISRHRGPAIITPHIEKWLLRNQLHREDGPAIVSTDPTKKPSISWHWHGQSFRTLEQWAEVAKPNPELFTMLKLEYG